MKNILFLGPYRQNDGWGNAAKEYLRALSHTGHNIVARPLYLNTQRAFDPLDEFSLLESKHEDKFDVVIQNAVPDMFRRYEGVKNIGISFFETTINSTPWPQSLELMDQLWVTSRFDFEFVLNNIRTQQHIVKVPCSYEKYTKEYSYNNLLKNHSHEFKFYFIGELTQRKNLYSLLTAFHLAFSPAEPVRLVLKVNKVGASERQTLQEIQSLISSVKQDLHLYQSEEEYSQEIIISDFLSDDDLVGIHKECDCFVMPSSGEGFCLPAFDAMGFGSYLLVNKHCGASQLVEQHRNGLYIDSNREPAIASDRPLEYLYNGRDYWYPVSIRSLIKRLRDVYSMREKLEKEKNFVQGKNLEMVSRHSYPNIANLINGIL